MSLLKELLATGQIKEADGDSEDDYFANHVTRLAMEAGKKHIAQIVGAIKRQDAVSDVTQSHTEHPISNLSSVEIGFRYHAIFFVRCMFSISGNSLHTTLYYDPDKKLALGNMDRSAPRAELASAQKVSSLMMNLKKGVKKIEVPAGSKKASSPVSRMIDPDGGEEAASIAKKFADKDRLDNERREKEQQAKAASLDKAKADHAAAMKPKRGAK